FADLRERPLRVNLDWVQHTDARAFSPGPNGGPADLQRYDPERPERAFGRQTGRRRAGANVMRRTSVTGRLLLTAGVCGITMLGWAASPPQGEIVTASTGTAAPPAERTPNLTPQADPGTQPEGTPPA